MSSKKKQPATRAVVENRQQVHPPLDFSFKTIQEFSDLLREKPRLRDHQLRGAFDLEDELSVGSSQDSIDIEKFPSTALKVNNNILVVWDGFMSSICKLFEDPVSKLGWIDFSFNDLKTIDECLLELPNLTTIYLHGNNILTMTQVDKLSRLEKLKSLTLHGNPIEINTGYRFYVIARLPQLQTFDFSGITKADRATCDTWKTMIAPKPKSRRKRDDD